MADQSDRMRAIAAPRPGGPEALELGALVPEAIEVGVVDAIGDDLERDVVPYVLGGHENHRGVVGPDAPHLVAVGAGDQHGVTVRDEGEDPAAEAGEDHLRAREAVRVRRREVLARLTEQDEVHVDPSPAGPADGVGLAEVDPADRWECCRCSGGRSG